jgi:hypothetical protein
VGLQQLFRGSLAGREAEALVDTQGGALVCWVAPLVAVGGDDVAYRVGQLGVVAPEDAERGRAHGSIPADFETRPDFASHPLRHEVAREGGWDAARVTVRCRGTIRRVDVACIRRRMEPAAAGVPFQGGQE